MRSRFPYGQIVFLLVLLGVVGYFAYRATEPIPPKPWDQQIESADDLPTDETTIQSERSGRWPAVRAAFLKLHPCCEACGTKTNLNVHHIKPFHLWPELELEPSNLITLCEKHHFYFGHDADGPSGPKKPNWKTSNRNVWRDARRERALR